MSHEEVYAVFNQVSAFTIHPRPSSTCGMESLKLESEDIIARTKWLYPDYIGVLVCFDEAGNLIRYQMFVD